MPATISVNFASNPEAIAGSLTNKSIHPAGLAAALTQGGGGSGYVTVAGNQTITGTKTFSSTIVGSINGSSASTTGNAATATTLQTARTIGGVSFNGSANINLPGVNTAGNQDTSGNAATATTLQTARTIGGVSFNGSASINLPGVNTAGNQNTSGNAATATNGAAAWGCFSRRGANSSTLFLKSYNIESIEPLNTGIFIINFASNMPNRKYAVIGTNATSTGGTDTTVVNESAGSNDIPSTATPNFGTNDISGKDVDRVKMRSTSAGTGVACSEIYVAVFASPD
jgi:hypothetical protein